MCTKRLLHGTSQHTQRNRESPHHDTPFAKTRLCGDIYPDRHLVVEIHLGDKICRLWTQKEKTALHLVSRPSDLSTAGVKDKELFIHNTLHRGSADRATVREREEAETERGPGRETRGRKSGREKEREREGVVSGTLYQGEDGALSIHRRRRGPRKSMVVKQRANGDVWRPSALLWIS